MDGSGNNVEPCYHTAALIGWAAAVRRMRRGLRDVRDRAARRRSRWREVYCAGMVGGDHLALVLISHEGIDRREVHEGLHRRGPDAIVKELQHEEPTWVMSPADAADLGRCRRGVEPEDRHYARARSAATTSPI